MVEFTAAPGDVEMGLEPRRLVLVEKRSSSGRMWTIIGALILLVACFGGAVLFVWHLNGKAEATPQLGQTEALVNRISSAASSENAGHNNTLISIGSSAKSAIHLEAHTESAEGRQLEWLTNQGQAFSQGDLQLRDNSIVIPKNGLYFVYSQASFGVSCDSGRHGSGRVEPTPLSHRIWRHADSMGGQVPLMSGERSACQSAGGATEGSEPVSHNWHNTIYLGAVFKLKKNDRLWTETNPMSKVEKEEGKTFFGVFAL